MLALLSTAGHKKGIKHSSDVNFELILLIFDKICNSISHNTAPKSASGGMQLTFMKCLGFSLLKILQFVLFTWPIK